MYTKKEENGLKSLEPYSAVCRNMTLSQVKMGG